MSDNLTEGEEALMKLRTRYREAYDQLDESRAKAEHATEMLDKLQRSRPNELSNKLMQLSETHQATRVKELRATRKAEELDEKVKYLTALLKGKQESINQLEEMAKEA